MLASIILQVPLALFPGPTPPTCQLEVLSPSTLEERTLHDFDQRIDRLVILNAHGGNQFQPLVRDLQSEHGILIVVANFYEMVPDVKQAVFESPGDHADELETSLLLHLCPELVELKQAGKGERVPFAIKALAQPGVWTPRPWSKSHPDTGSGDPSRASAEKGKTYFEAVVEAIANLICDLANAKKGQLPYV